MSVYAIDSHIHLDLYNKSERQMIVHQMDQERIKAMITVSYHLKSAKNIYQLAKNEPNIYPAFGYHPEQALPTDEELEELLSFMDEKAEAMIAVGEVGLPYYLRREQPEIPIEPYEQLLETFIKQATTLNKPIILHAVYDDAPIVCDLLEKHSIKQAHFHWFKGDQKTIERILTNGYYISITPDVLYKQRTRKLVRDYSLAKMMVETDGPWKFAGPFTGQMTHPKMIHQTIKEIAEIKKVNVNTVYETILQNTKQFYHM